MPKKDEVFDFEEKESNIEEYLGKIITVKDVNVDEGETMSITTLLLDNGEEVSTTSAVVMKQAKKLKENDKLPFRAKVIKKKSGESKFSYYALGKPTANEEDDD